MQASQLGEINRLAVEAEPPGKGRDAEACQDDRPAAPEFADRCAGTRLAERSEVVHEPKCREPATARQSVTLRSAPKHGRGVRAIVPSCTISPTSLRSRWL